MADLNMLAPRTIASRNGPKLALNTNADFSRLSFARLSFAFFIVGIFWLFVELHEYVVWLRGGERAIFVAALIVSCIIIYLGDRMGSDCSVRRGIERIYFPIFVLFLTFLTIDIAYVIVSEPSPISLQFTEIPDPLSLKLDGIAVIFLVLLPFGAAVAKVRIDEISPYIPVLIVTFCITCLFSRFLSFWYYTCSADFPHTLFKCHGYGLADIGGTTLNAVHAILKGLNPYTIDVQANYTNVPERGYTYWPMMFVLYMPLVSLFPTGWGAIRLTNFAMDMISAILVFVLVCRRSGWLSGALAASLYLMLPLLPWRVYSWGDTDLAPTVLLLAALALYQKRPSLAGLMVGLSVSAKFLPGLLMLVCCFPETRRSRYMIGFVVGLVPAIVFYLLAPWDFITNTMWMLASKPNGSSWLYQAPSYMIIIARITFILVMIAVSLVIVLRPPDLFKRCILYVVCVCTLLLTAKYHNNYAIWWIPFFCILLSSPLSRILSLSRSTAVHSGV